MSARQAKNPDEAERQDEMPQPEITKYLDDIDLMIEHCRKQGIVLPTSIASEIALIVPSEKKEPMDADKIKNAMRVHGQLCGKIAPATPRSLDAAKFSWDKWCALKIWLFVMAVLFPAAFIGLIGFCVTLPTSASPALTQPDPNAPSDPNAERLAPASPQDANSVAPADPNTAKSVATQVGETPNRWQTQLNYLFAAMVGAAFSGLLTAYTYLRNRSFDPNYVALYMIRFVLGLVAGVILANLWPTTAKQGGMMEALGPGITALLGGYSAEAVRQILDRLVEVLVTTVRGKQDTGAQERLTIAKEVLTIRQAAAEAQPDAADLTERLDALITKLQE